MLPRMKLLVVEDDAALQATLVRTLLRRGFGVTALGDGAAALERWSAAPPDAVVLDLTLPTLDGNERALRTDDLVICDPARATGLAGVMGGLDTETTADEINAAFKAAFSDTDYYGYNDEGIVSSDILGDTHGGVFDPTQTDVNTIDGVTLARTVSFYDNEYGFTSNMIRTLLYFAEISE